MSKPRQAGTEPSQNGLKPDSSPVRYSPSQGRSGLSLVRFRSEPDRIGPDAGQEGLSPGTKLGHLGISQETKLGHLGTTKQSFRSAKLNSSPARPGPKMDEVGKMTM
ncbi:unnamed protein product [Caenorhabditis brenneri]